jgi:formyltetrahydrofolate synthetase
LFLLSGFDISIASGIMAVLALATDLADMRAGLAASDVILQCIGRL